MNKFKLAGVVILRWSISFSWVDFGDWDKDTVTRKEQVDYIDVKVDCTLQLLSLGALCENLEKHGRRDSS